MPKGIKNTTINLEEKVLHAYVKNKKSIDLIIKDFNVGRVKITSILDKAKVKYKRQPIGKEKLKTIIKNMYLAGKSMSTIEKQVGAWRSTIIKYLSQESIQYVSPRNKHKYISDNKDLINELYLKGTPIEIIAKNYNTSNYYIKKVLGIKKVDITLRKRRIDPLKIEQGRKDIEYFNKYLLPTTKYNGSNRNLLRIEYLVSKNYNKNEIQKIMNLSRQTISSKIKQINS
jgi:transposase